MIDRTLSVRPGSVGLGALRQYTLDRAEEGFGDADAFRLTDRWVIMSQGFQASGHYAIGYLFEVAVNGETCWIDADGCFIGYEIREILDGIVKGAVR